MRQSQALSKMALDHWSQPVTSTAQPSGFRLDIREWESLAEIAGLEQTTISDILQRVGTRSPRTLAKAVEEFVVGYYRERAERRLR
jgi:hypothetical protein